MDTPRTALGPQRLQDGGKSPFGIARDAWQNVQTYTSTLAALDPQIVTALSGPMPALSNLHDDCRRWKTGTFGIILRLARTTYDYAAAVPAAYAPLEAILQAAEQGSDRAGNLARFNAIIGGLIDRSASLAATAAKLLPDIQSLAAHSQLASAELAALGDPNTVITAAMVKLLSPPRDAASLAQFQYAVTHACQTLAKMTTALSSVGSGAIVQTIEQIRGGWSAIGSDLGDVRQWVADQVDLSQPFVAELAVDAAVGEWGDIAKEVQDFIGYGSQLSQP